MFQQLIYFLLTSSFVLAPGIRVTLPKKPVPLILDWRGHKFANVRVNGRPQAVVVENEHLVIGPRALKGGANSVELQFEAPVAASGTAITRYRDREDGAEYLYTLLVPERVDDFVQSLIDHDPPRARLAGHHDAVLDVVLGPTLHAGFDRFDEGRPVVGMHPGLPGLERGLD